VIDVSNTELAAEARKLFLEKFPHVEHDDPIAEMASWNALLEHKVDDFGNRLDTWTLAILKQTDLATQQNQLIVSQNLTLQETGKNNAALGKTLLQFKSTLSQLQQELKSLENTIETHRVASGSLNVSVQNVNKALNSQLKALEQKMDTLAEKINPLPQAKKVEELNEKFDSLIEAWNAERWFIRAALVLLLLPSLAQVFLLGHETNQIQFQVDSVDKKVNSALRRLERIEKN